VLSTKLLIFVEKVVCNFWCYFIFHSFFSLRSNSWSIPIFLFLALLFLFCPNSWLHRSLRLVGSVWVYAAYFWLLFFLNCLWGFISCLIPFFSNLLLPVLILLNLSNSLFDNLKCLGNFKVFHVFVVVEFICEFKKFVNFTFFVFFLLSLSRCPCWFWSFLSSQFALLALLTWLIHLLF